MGEPQQGRDERDGRPQKLDPYSTDHREDGFRVGLNFSRRAEQLKGGWEGAPRADADESGLSQRLPGRRAERKGFAVTQAVSALKAMILPNSQRTRVTKPRRAAMKYTTAARGISQSARVPASRRRRAPTAGFEPTDHPSTTAGRIFNAQRRVSYVAYVNVDGRDGRPKNLTPTQPITENEIVR